MKVYFLNWYLVQIKPKAHVTACQHLKRQGFEVFSPLIIKTAKKNGKFIDITTLLFPGYLFLGTQIEPVPWRTINSTRGISKAVTLDGTYRPIHTQIVEGLKLRCDRSGIIHAIDNISPGERAKIKRGPFSNFICNVDEMADGRRAWVLIDLLKQKTRAKISLDDLSIIN